MSMFKAKVIAPKPGDFPFSPVGILEASFESMCLTNSAEVDYFRSRCIQEIEQACSRLKRGLATAQDKVKRVSDETRFRKLN